MLARVEHRGPDGSHVLDLGKLAIGAARLAIQSAPLELQPLSEFSRGVALAFNGELFNKHELLQRLPDSDRNRLGDASDTRILFAGLQSFGPSYIRHAEGMYAFAWWQSDKLTLFRDVFG